MTKPLHCISIPTGPSRVVRAAVWQPPYEGEEPRLIISRGWLADADTFMRADRPVLTMPMSVLPALRQALEELAAFTLQSEQENTHERG